MLYPSFLNVQNGLGTLARMNKQQILVALRQQNRPEQFDWVLRLGAKLTVAARAAYPVCNGNIEHLVGFNEMQHHIFGWLRHPQTEDEWTIEQLFDSLLAMAARYGIEGDFGWAVKTSLQIPS
jgi:hypothetical protein